MEERLISRFGWGLTVAIEPPELEMRVAIVLKKAEAEAVELSEDIAFFIAKHIRSNVRELEGALKKVLAFARFNGRELSLELAKEALRDILNVASRQVSVEGIQKTVAEYFKIKISDMHSKKRSRNVARPRQVAMALAKDLTQMSLPEIGEAFGNRDHTTVLHACRTIASLRKQDTGAEPRLRGARAGAEGLRMNKLCANADKLWVRRGFARHGANSIHIRRTALHRLSRASIGSASGCAASAFRAYPAIRRASISYY